MAATERSDRRRGVDPLAIAAAALAAGAVVAPAAGADLPQDQADTMLHLYDGGGVRASGPAVLVRKSIGDKVSLNADYLIDMVSNASIDVVTTASPYKERRVQTGLGGQFLYEGALISLGTEDSREPDYRASTTNLDLSQEVFGGLTTVSMGFTHGYDHVGKHGEPDFAETATHWQYRLGASQVLTPRWVASANVEIVSDAGYLGSPYRAARVFGAAVPERVPSTRSSRALQLRAVGDIDGRSSVHASYRYFWDNWAIHANTAELGYSHRQGERWLIDASARAYAQTHALFYADNATSDTVYVTRNRQLGSFDDAGLSVSGTYTAIKVPAKYEITLSASYQLLRFKYHDFTDLRTGLPYSFTANVLEFVANAKF